MDTVDHTRKMNKKDIFVTKPFMPPYEEFEPYLKEIWKSARLTNNGIFHQQLERALCDYLGVEYLTLCSSGTTGLLMAIHSLGRKGEVITTPFSFPATTHAISWLGMKPVFADIEPDLLNIDPEQVERAITPETIAILPVHVYGNPCMVREIQRISEKYNIPVIYDACHTFGVNYEQRSILEYGDLSVLSFHPTKVFSTFEGGAVICKDASRKKEMDLLKNFGIANEETVLFPGINGKMNEVQAAFGLVQLPYMQTAKEKRRVIVEKYRELLRDVPGIRLFPEIQGLEGNYSYLPVKVIGEESRMSRDLLYDHLKKHSIHPRKYFYPLISHGPAYNSLPSANGQNLPVASLASEQVLCLPLYADLELEAVEDICEIISAAL
jgi:dTDP-4-amino-4,6-dideoxygalactose transaminase